MFKLTKKEVIIYEDVNGNKPFYKWLLALDSSIIRKIEQRLLRVAVGNLGDHKYLLDGIYELRFTIGAGYRIYYGEDKNDLIILLYGGNKKGQHKDIKKAIRLWKEYKNGKKISDI